MIAAAVALGGTPKPPMQRHQSTLPFLSVARKIRGPDNGSLTLADAMRESPRKTRHDETEWEHRWARRSGERHACHLRHLRHPVRRERGPPERCPICADERQFVGWAGQRWTTLEDLRAQHRLALKDEGDGLLGIGAEPKFAIGQRALLVPARAGDRPGRNVLWDCISLIDDAAVRVVEALGGISAIAHLAPALLRLDGGMEPGVRRRADLPARRRSPLGDAPGPGDRVLGGRGARARRRPDAAPPRRPFRRRAGAALGRAAPTAAARCSPATSSRWCRTAASSASCTATRTTSRCRRRPCAAWSTRSSPTPSSASTAPGSARWCARTARPRCAARPSATSSALETDALARRTPAAPAVSSGRSSARK